MSLNLTPRQIQVLQAAADGETGEQTAARLHIAYHTVREHHKEAKLNLGVHSKAHAVAVAMRMGLIT